MPPTRKPPELRQRRNKDGTVGNLAVLPDVAVEVPEHPKLRLKATREAWVSFWESEVAKLIDPKSDLPALTRLFKLYDELGSMSNHVDAHGRLSTGSTGQLSLDPIYKHMGTIRSEITQLEDRFGLTPLARLKLGAQLGDAAASLDRMNAQFRTPDSEPERDDDDPRLAAIDTTAS